MLNLDRYLSPELMSCYGSLNVCPRLISDLWFSLKVSVRVRDLDFFVFIQLLDDYFLAARSKRKAPIKVSFSNNLAQFFSFFDFSVILRPLYGQTIFSCASGNSEIMEANMFDFRFLQDFL